MTSVGFDGSRFSFNTSGTFGSSSSIKRPYFCRTCLFKIVLASGFINVTKPLANSGSAKPVAPYLAINNNPALLKGLLAIAAPVQQLLKRF